MGRVSTLPFDVSLFGNVHTLDLSRSSTPINHQLLSEDATLYVVSQDRGHAFHMAARRLRYLGLLSTPPLGGTWYSSRMNEVVRTLQISNVDTSTL